MDQRRGRGRVTGDSPIESYGDGIEFLYLPLRPQWKRAINVLLRTNILHSMIQNWEGFHESSFIEPNGKQLPTFM